MILIDGVRYHLWNPEKEEELEAIVKEHFREIFGQDAVPFDKSKLQTHFKEATIPDGYIVHLGKEPGWSILEVELSKHPLHDHITTQMNKFIDAIKSQENRSKIIEEFHTAVKNNVMLKGKFKAKLGDREIHEFLTEVISQQPTLVIVIEEKTQELESAVSLLKLEPRIVELKTFVRESVGLAVHAHLFKPLVKEERIVSPPTPPQIPVSVTQSRSVTPPRDNKIDVILTGGARQWKKRNSITLGAANRGLFPGHKMPFVMETDVENITTWVTARRVGAHIRTLYVAKNMKPWFNAHPELKPGDKLIIEAIEPHKKYRLSIVQQ